MRLVLAFVIPFAMAGPTNSCAASLPCSVADADGDGHDAIECGGDDCDDDNASRYPGAVEVCDLAGLDEDCDLSTGGDKDLDGDGFHDVLCCNVGADDDDCGTDCDDTVASTSPVGTEICNGTDDNCDGQTDEGLLVEFFTDDDQDGFGGVSFGELCAQDQGTLARRGGDCNDDNPAIHPGAVLCGQLPEEVFVCEADGFYRDDTCGAQLVCHVQPNATGVCAP